MPKIFNTIVFITIFTQYELAIAGAHGLTIHSRANCAGFNESISWDATRKYWLETRSRHVSPLPNFSHTGTSHQEFTWRSANCHFAEAWKGDNWLVYGQHWISNDGKNWQILGYTEASDCSLYDGWWG